ncbi:hypothetical protein [Chondrinema litorale]|uniref:hypothetical protein n=1 Tax=Chondrinema litorale TaxID=2994555 RepID=UPI002542CB35|nr:hypothetical protein [Chondrinema litorale]UZR97917.1 hypothetical protein OQ292_29315 [Chondrinema litorale]
MKRKIVIAIFILITTTPLLFGFGYSLLYSFGLTGILSKGFTIEHWQMLFTESDGISSLFYTIFLTIISLILILLPALVLAWWQTNSAQVKWLKAMLFLPLCFPPLVAAFAMYHLLSPTGIYSRVFYQLGLIEQLEDFPRLVNDFASIGILAAHVFMVFPLFTLLFINQVKKERLDELMATSLTLGASGFYFFRKVFAPVILMRSSPLIVLYGIFLMGTYEVPLLLGRSSPRVVTVFITEKIKGFSLQDIPQGHAMAVVYTLLVITITTFFLSINRKTISGS